MIRRKHRFHGHSSLKFVYAKGKQARSQLLGLRYVPNTRIQETRVAVVVSTKISKCAPVRNRIRRRIFEYFRLRLGELPQGHDLVITVYSDRLATVPSASLYQTLDKLLAQSGLLTALERGADRGGYGIVSIKEKGAD